MQNHCRHTPVAYPHVPHGMGWSACKQRDKVAITSIAATPARHRQHPPASPAPGVCHVAAILIPAPCLRAAARTTSGSTVDAAAAGAAATGATAAGGTTGGAAAGGAPTPMACMQAANCSGVRSFRSFSICICSSSRASLRSSRPLLPPAACLSICSLWRCDLQAAVPSPSPG